MAFTYILIYILGVFQIAQYTLVEWMKQCDIWVNRSHKKKQNKTEKLTIFSLFITIADNSNFSVERTCGSVDCYLLTFLKSQLVQMALLI